MNTDIHRLRFKIHPSYIRVNPFESVKSVVLKKINSEFNHGLRGSKKYSLLYNLANMY